MSVTNTKTVGEFVASIRNSLEKSNKAWVEIANAFAEAREMFGSGSDSFKRLLKETKFSAATAHKLATIASSERLKAYQEKLVGVQSWSTLYAIQALPEEKFEKLKTEYKLDNPSTIPPFITLGRVEAIRKGDTPKSPLRLFATISIDEDALVGELIDDHYLQELEDTIAKMAASIPYVRVLKTNVVRRQRLWDRIGDLSNGGFLAHRNPKESEDEPEILRPTRPRTSRKAGPRYSPRHAQAPFR